MAEPSRAVARYDGPRTTDELERYSRVLAVNDTGDRQWRNDALPATFRGNPAAVAFAVEYAKALDVSPVTAIIGIHIVDGKPTASAGLISALIRRAGHKIRTWTEGSIAEGNAKGITTITRADDPEFTYRSEWTLDRAVRAGLMKRTPDGLIVAAKDKSAWATYPENMLKSRSITECARDAAEDAILGVHYTPEELGVDVDEVGDPVYQVTSLPARDEPKRAPQTEAAIDRANEAAENVQTRVDQDAAGDPEADLEVDVTALADTMRTAILAARDADALLAAWRDYGMTREAAQVLGCGDEYGEETTVFDLFVKAGDAIKAGTTLTDDDGRPRGDDGGTPAEPDPRPPVAPEAGTSPDPDPVVEVHEGVVVEDVATGIREVDAAEARARLDAVMVGLTPEQVQDVVSYCRLNGLNPGNGPTHCDEIARAIVSGAALSNDRKLDEDAVALCIRVLGAEIVDEWRHTTPAEKHAAEMANRRAAALDEDRADRTRTYSPQTGGGHDAFKAARAATGQKGDTNV